jgi:signal transduction histidine kinase
MQQSQLSVSPFSKSPDDSYLTESILAIQGNQLTGIASELNRLRIHHREILDNLPIGVMSVDEKGEILKWNQTLQSYTGIPESTAVGSLVTDLPNPWHSQILLFLTTDQNASKVIEIELAGQNRWFGLQKSTSSIVESSDGQLSEETGEDLIEEIIILFEDHTEAMLLTKTSIDNQRLASAGRLAAGVAHEIGNPLTGITCLAQDLKRESKTPQTDNYADQILSQTDRINRIIKSLISFTKGGDMDLANPSTVSITAVVEEAIDLLQLDREKTPVDYRCAIERDFSIWADQHQLVQIFVNLLSNARDASAEGDPVLIETKVEEHSAKVIVRDRGQGIPEQIRPHLFEPFVSSKDPGEGAGLGLWIVFNLAEKIGAKISIESTTEGPSKGTSAVLNFPSAVTDQKPLAT